MKRGCIESSTQEMCTSYVSANRYAFCSAEINCSQTSYTLSETGATYHLMERGIRRQAIYEEEGDYQGHLFEGHYKACLVKDDAYFGKNAAIRYRQFVEDIGHKYVIEEDRIKRSMGEDDLWLPW